MLWYTGCAVPVQALAIVTDSALAVLTGLYSFLLMIGHCDMMERV